MIKGSKVIQVFTVTDFQRLVKSEGWEEWLSLNGLDSGAKLGDIGQHFPDTDPAYKNADSTELLKKSYSLVRKEGFSVENIDSTVVAEKPKLSKFIPDIKKSISDLLKCDEKQVSVKATTNEKMGFVGREEGIAVHAVVLLKRG